MGDSADTGIPPELGFEENDQQRLDAIDISVIIEYVMENAYDEVAERVMEEKVNGL